MKILITAFEPFGGDDYNNSILVLNKLDNEYIKHIIPVSYPDSKNKVEELVDFYKPNLIIHLGMAKNRDKLTIEQTAKNKLKFVIPDNNGNILDEPIDSNCNLEFINNKIDFSNICNLEQFKDKLYLSLDAGTYICNYVYFTSLFHYNTTNVLFIHIPSFNDNCTLDECVNTIKELINYLKGF